MGLSYTNKMDSLKKNPLPFATRLLLNCARIQYHKTAIKYHSTTTVGSCMCVSFAHIQSGLQMRNYDKREFLSDFL